MYKSYEEDFLASLKKQEEEFKAKTEKAGNVSIKLSTVRKRIDPLTLRVFSIIVSNGLSKEKEIKEIVVQQLIEVEMLKRSKDAIYRSINKLVTLGLFDIVPISTGIRTFHLLKITDVGIMLYMQEFDKQPPKSEMEIVASNHASYTHGYMIEEVKNILEQRATYAMVTTDRVRNKLVLPDKTVIIPDIIAGTNTNWEMFEVECGTHNNSDFYHKCDKLIRVKRRLNFIGSGRESVEKYLIPKITAWINHKNPEALLNLGVTISVYSMYDFKRGKCTYYYDMKSSEPVCLVKKSKRKERITKSSNGKGMNMKGYEQNFWVPLFVY